MNGTITITSDKKFNAYTVAPEECPAVLSRQNWNHKNRESAPWYKVPGCYWVTGYVNGVFMSLELHNYRDAKRLFLAMCKG